MTEELDKPDYDRAFINAIKEKLASLPDLINDSVENVTSEQLKGNLFSEHNLEELRLAYDTLTELRKDCEQLHGVADRLLETKAKSEEDARTIEKLTEENQKFEDENRIHEENNAVLQVFFEHAKNSSIDRYRINEE